MHEAIQKVYQLNEAKALIEEAQNAGPIDLIYKDQFEMNARAMWDALNRKIIINGKFQPDTAKMIHSILFELQNAAATPSLNSLTNRAIRGEVTKKEFVDGIEWIEHQNALRTKHLLEKGIAQGLFPEASRWPVPEKFEDHLSMQRSSGHSDFIARKYDMMQRNRNLPLPS